MNSKKCKVHSEIFGYKDDTNPSQIKIIRRKQMAKDFEIFSFLKSQSGGNDETRNFSKREQQISAQLKFPGSKFCAHEKSKSHQKSMSLNQSILNSQFKTSKKIDPDEMRIKRFQQSIQKKCNNLKYNQMIQHQRDLKMDLQFLDVLTTQGYNQFINQLALHHKYFSQELLDDEGICKKEDLNIEYMKIREDLPSQSYNDIKDIKHYQGLPLQNIDRHREILHKFYIPMEKVIGPYHQMQNMKDKIKNIKLNSEEIEFLTLVKEDDVRGASLRLKIDENLANIQDEMMQTPLHWCAKRNLIEMCRLLINYGAKTNILDIGNRDAKTLAQAFKNYQIAKLITMEERDKKDK